MPGNVPVVLTTVLAGKSDWGDLEWERIVRLGEERAPFCVVHVLCDLEENMRRIQSEDRDLKRKPRDPTMAQRNHTGGKTLVGSDASNLLKLDVTSLSAADAARTIADWTKTV